MALVPQIPRSPRRAAVAFIFLLATALVSAFTRTSAAAISLPESLSSYDNVALLDQRLELHWTVNGSDATIRLAVRANTAGWLAIAISEIGSMAGSDALVAWVAENEGRVYATDCFIFNTSATGTALDDQQDWHVLGGSQMTNQSTGDTWTTVHVWRLLDTGDCNDRPIISGKLHNIIWAMGPTDKVGYHNSTRGGGTLVLARATDLAILEPSAPPSTASPSAGSDSARGVGRLGVERQQVAGEVEVQAGLLNFTVTDYPVPTDRSSYRCMVIDVPLESKEHAVEWGPVINTTHVSSLHHSFLYGCSSEEYPDLLPAGMIFDCVGRAPCSTFVAVWAWGGRPFTFPPNIGYPIGPGYFTKFVLEMHYVNPEGRTDIIDSSGVYLKLASSPDLQDAHIMKVGLVDHTNLIRVPPAMPSWTLANSCPGECTAAVFKNQSVKIVASILHEHNIGRQVYTEVLRKGSTVATINRIDYFDYASQQTMPVQPEFELLPGDEIRTNCVWDSTSRSNLTVGGPAAENEMCVNYLVYYSATQGQEMHACYTVCGAMDNETLTIDPSRLDLTTHYVCGPGHNPYIPTGKSCVISYGCNDNVTVLYGCPDQTRISLSTIPVDDISTLLQPGSTLSPSSLANNAASTANTNGDLSPTNTNALASAANATAVGPPSKTNAKAAPAAATDGRTVEGQGYPFRRLLSLPPVALLSPSSPCLPSVAHPCSRRPPFPSPSLPVALPSRRPRFPRRPAIHSPSPSPSLPSPFPSCTLVTLPFLSLLPLFPPSNNCLPSTNLYPFLASPYPQPCFPPSPSLLPPISFPSSPHLRPCFPPFPLPASPHTPPCFPPSPSLLPPIPLPASPHPLPCSPPSPSLLPPHPPPYFPPSPSMLPPIPFLASPASPSLLPPIPFPVPPHPLPCFPPIPLPTSPHPLPCSPPSPSLLPPHPPPCFPPSPSLLPPIPFPASPHPVPCFPPSRSLLPPIPFPASPHPLPCSPP
ncbi:unnamed protein product [Closterium sp. NIES-65]|nr:unnamed protein product [Closterium sp. NIES-65]